MEVKSKYPFVFQVDSDIVQSVYKNNKNFLIDYNENCDDKSTCAIYFSSNDIYYPNDESIFTKRIIEKDFYEWYGTRLDNVYKHILIRDVFKQWYLSGINENINTPEKLKAFLLSETEGYTVTTVGSSAGGYAAVLYGSIVNAKKVLVFNAQFEINSLLETSTETIDPFIFRKQDTEVRKYYDIKPYVSKNIDIFYFTSLNSTWDSEQSAHIKDVENIHQLKFKTGHHGIPFLKSALSVVLNLEPKTLKTFSKKVNHPVVFSLKMIGLINVIIGTYQQLSRKYKRRK